MEHSRFEVITGLGTQGLLVCLFVCFFVWCSFYCFLFFFIGMVNLV
jgi:hypothetical protein